MRVGSLVGVAALLLGTACYPTTTRPRVEPVPEATLIEVELFVPDATRALAVALDADSIPVARTEPDDGWLETGWFDSETLQPTTRRPLGMDVVKVRAWADPSRPNHSQLTVEVVYRPFADPSRDPRLLERTVPDTHRVARRVAAVLQALEERYGAGQAYRADMMDRSPPRMAAKPPRSPWRARRTAPVPPLLRAGFLLLLACSGSRGATDPIAVDRAQFAAVVDTVRTLRSNPPSDSSLGLPS